MPLTPQKSALFGPGPAPAVVAGMQWICCPYCGEVANLTRVGSIGKIRGGGVKHPFPWRKPDTLTVSHSKFVHCGFCKKTFRTDGATLWEVFGRDSNY